MKYKLIGFALVLALFLSCQKENEQHSPGTNYIEGAYINPQYSDSIITFERFENLIDNAYGLAFKEGGKLTERKNSGWCGTPPISYGDFEGNWSENDSIINIEVAFWGGTVVSKWKLLSITDDFITVHQLSVEYIEE